MSEASEEPRHVYEAKEMFLSTTLGIIVLLLGVGTENDLWKFIGLLVGSFLIINGVVFAGTRAIFYWVVDRSTDPGTDPEAAVAPDGLADRLLLGAGGVAMVLLTSVFGFGMSWITTGGVSVIFEAWGWIALLLLPLTAVVLPFFLPWIALKYGVKRAVSDSGASRATAGGAGSEPSSTPTDAAQSRPSGATTDAGEPSGPDSGPTGAEPDGVRESDPTSDTDAGGVSDAPETVTEGDAVRVRYTVRAADSGEVVDTTDRTLAFETDLPGADHVDGPRTIVLGRGLVFDPVDRDMVGRAVGDTNTVTVPAAAAFGPTPVDPDPQTVAVADLPPEFRFEGAHVRLDGGYRHVTAIVGSRARVEYGHPLAGQDLVVSYQIVDVVDDESVGPVPGYLVQYRDPTADDPDEGGVDWGPRAREMRRQDE